MSPGVWEVLNSPDTILESDQDAEEKIRCTKFSFYTDRVLQNDADAYLSFVKRLWSASMISFVKVPRCFITPFFCRKERG